MLSNKRLSDTSLKHSWDKICLVYKRPKVGEISKRKNNNLFNRYYAIKKVFVTTLVRVLFLIWHSDLPEMTLYFQINSLGCLCK